MKLRGFLWMIVAALAACSSTAEREPPAPLVDFDAAYQVKEAWSTELGSGGTKGYLRLMPQVVDGVVYAADPSGRVSAFAVDSGSRKWRTDLEVPVSGAVGVGGNLVVVGTRHGQVIALERDTGKKIWVAPVTSEVLAPPAIGGGVVVAQAVDGRLFGFAASDGKRLWVHERTEPALSLRGTGRPVVVTDAVLAGFASGKIAALRLRDGGVLWEATVSQPRGRNEIERLIDVDVSPLVFPDVVYAASFQGKLVALNPRSGAVLWSRDVSTYAGIVADSSRIYVSDEKSHVLAFDRRSGATAWKQEGLRGRRLSAPVVYDDVIAVGDSEGYVHWLARDDGRFVARYKVDSSPIRAPGAIDGDTLFVIDTAGTLAALRLVQK